jgi:hypothetical protein
MVTQKMAQQEYIILCLEDSSDWLNATTRRTVMQASAAGMDGTNDGSRTHGNCCRHAVGQIGSALCGPYGFRFVCSINVVFAEHVDCCMACRLTPRCPAQSWSAPSWTHASPSSAHPLMWRPSCTRQASPTTSACWAAHPFSRERASRVCCVVL